MFQTLDLDPEGKLMKCHRLIMKSIIDILEHSKASGVRQFRRIAASIMSTSQPQRPHSRPESVSSATQDALRATQKQLKAIAARFSTDKNRNKGTTTEDTGRRATAPTVFGSHSNNSQNSLSSAHSEPATLAPARKPSVSPILARPRTNTSQPPRRRVSSNSPNLDFLSFTGPAPPPLPSPSPHQTSKTPANILHARHSIAVPPNPNKTAEITSAAEWERLIGSLDQSDTNIYDTIYGGTAPDALRGVDLTTLPLSIPLSATAIEAQNLAWDTQTQHINHHPPRSSIATTTANSGIWTQLPGGSLTLDGYPMLSPPAPVPQSVLSFSDESLSSGGDEFTSSGGGSGMSVGSAGQGIAFGTDGGVGEEIEMFRGLVIPAEVSPGLYASDTGLGLEDDMGGLDAGFGL